MAKNWRDLTARFRSRANRMLDDLNELEEREEPVLGGEHEMEGGQASDTHVHIYPAQHSDDRRDKRDDDDRHRRDRRDDRRGRRDARHYFTDPGEEGGDMPMGGGEGEGDLAEIGEQLRALQDEHEEMLADLDAIMEHCGLDAETLDSIRHRRRDARRRRDDGRHRDRRDDDRHRADARRRDGYDTRRADRRDDDDDRRRDRRDDDRGRDRRADRRDRRDDDDDRRRDRRRDDDEGTNPDNEKLLGELEFEAPKGTGDRARKARDSAFMVDSFQETLAAAQVLVPGMRLPTFDGSLPPTKTLDCMCEVRRAALNEALRGRDHDVVAQLIGDKSPDDLDIPELRRAFMTAATIKRRLNNAATVSGIGRDSAQIGNGGGNGVVGSIKTPADFNRRAEQFWAEQKTGVTQH